MDLSVAKDPKEAEANSRHAAPSPPENSYFCILESLSAQWVVHNLNEVRAARRNCWVSNDLFITTRSSLLKLPGILKTYAAGYLMPAGSSTVSHCFSMLAIDILSHIQNLKHSLLCRLNRSFKPYKNLVLAHGHVVPYTKWFQSTSRS